MRFVCVIRHPCVRVSREAVLCRGGSRLPPVSTCQLLRVFLPGNRESASVLLSRLPPVSLNRSVL